MHRCDASFDVPLGDVAGRSHAWLLADQVTRLAVSFVLIGSALLKLHEMASGVNVWPVWLIAVVAPFELLLGVWLASGYYGKYARAACVACLTVFAVAALVKGLQGQSSCGCFGRVTVHPFATYLFDWIAATALAGFAPRFSSWSGPTRGAAILTITAPAALAVHFALLATADDVRVLEPAEWLGRRFALLESIDIGPSMEDGHWIVVLVQQGCPHCREVMPRYQKLAQWHFRNRDPTRIALVEIPPLSDQPPGAVGKCVWGRLDDTQSWFVSTPTEITLHDGLVTNVVEGEVAWLADTR